MTGDDYTAAYLTAVGHGASHNEARDYATRQADPTYADGEPLLSADAQLLAMRKAWLDRCENEMAAQSTPHTRKAWAEAYAKYWALAVEIGMVDAVPCDECGGAGAFAVCPHGHMSSCPCEEDVPCEVCRGSGHRPCDNCGEHPATVRVSGPHGSDLYCKQCAEEA